MSFLRWASFAFALGLVATSANADELTTNRGTTVSGKLLSVDAQGVSFSSSNATIKFPGKEIVLIDLGHKIVAAPKDKDVKPIELELTDGSIFRISRFAIKGKKVEIEMAAGPAGAPVTKFEIPLGSVFSIMRNADDPKSREAWKKLLASRGKRDLYVVREAEGLNYVAGTVLDGTDAGDVISFEKEDGARAELRLRNATGGLVFAQPPPASVPTTLCKAYDVFGNALVAQAVEINADVVGVTTVAGVTIKYPAVTLLSKLDYAQGNVAYLSDLDPQVDSPEQPPDEKGLRLNPTAPYTKDHGILGEPLKLQDEAAFPKGLSIAPETALTFNVGGEYREFKAVIGITETTPDANVEAHVTIEGDGRPLFSETIKRKDKHKAIGLDVKGVKQLRVIVESKLPVSGNRVILADARLQK